MSKQFTVNTLKKRKLNAIDRALLEPDEPITLEEFKKQLGMPEYNEK